MNRPQNLQSVLAGKIAVVTGSSSGIGRAIAIELATQGADIVVHGRGESAGIQKVCSEIRELGRSVETVFEDFCTPTNWKDFVDAAWASHGDVDFWINNAGGDVLTGEWADRKIEDKLNFLWQTDVVPSLMLSRLAGQRMQAGISSSEGINKEGDDIDSGQHSIINIGWDQAWQGMAGDSGELFSTTKGAIMAMTKSLAQSLAPNVRVNCIAPGWIKTKWGEQASEYWDARAKNDSLMNRWGTPEDIASVAAFLCSPPASFVSGQIVPVNGGFRHNG